MFELIASAFSWMTGNSKSADKAAAGVDMLIYTDEEKTIANDARLDKVLDFKIKHAERTQKQSIARRMIAVGFTAVFLLLVLVVIIAGYFDNSAESYSQFVRDTIQDLLLEPMGYIIMFYFAAHIVTGLKK